MVVVNILMLLPFVVVNRLVRGHSIRRYNSDRKFFPPLVRWRQHIQSPVTCRKNPVSHQKYSHSTSASSWLHPLLVFTFLWENFHWTTFPRQNFILQILLLRLTNSNPTLFDEGSEISPFSLLYEHLYGSQHHDSGCSRIKASLRASEFVVVMLGAGYRCYNDTCQWYESHHHHPHVEANDVDLANGVE